MNWITPDETIFALDWWKLLRAYADAIHDRCAVQDATLNAEPTAPPTEQWGEP